MISPILCATSPDTPVSISSKIIDGRVLYCDRMALTASIIRDNSPPDATFLREPKSEPLLAEKSKV